MLLMSFFLFFFQARSVKDRLLKSKTGYEELQNSLLKAGKELYGEDYTPKSLQEIASPAKQKTEPSKQALQVSNVPESFEVQ